MRLSNLTTPTEIKKAGYKLDSIMRGGMRRIDLYKKGSSEIIVLRNANDDNYTILAVWEATKQQAKQYLTECNRQRKMQVYSCA